MKNQTDDKYEGRHYGMGVLHSPLAGGNVLDMVKGDAFWGDKQEVLDACALGSCLACAEVSDRDKLSFSLGSTHFSQSNTKAC